MHFATIAGYASGGDYPQPNCGQSGVIAIIGGGCSGVLAAISLLREAPDEDLIVIEPREDLGRGMAYSTPWYEHLLNVPAAKMSALPSEPSHFAEWLTRRGWPPTCG
ncbi:MAG TPA: FAD/NAD(P)-binding protein, partial [Bryobacteraceae bacterium]|nr:FAD/NAD(P)-binding protein [Bryobacteraceae bacterium]